MPQVEQIYFRNKPQSKKNFSKNCPLTLNADFLIRSL